MKNNLRLLLLALCVANLTFSQEVFSFDQFMNQVKVHHPVSLAAELNVVRGEASVQSKRGAFDPVLFHGLNNKDFSELNYYYLSTTGMKIPTWYGIELEGGLNQNRGDYLNPENNLPENGLYYAGLSMPLGKGLFMDQRRAELKKAKIYSEMTQAERDQLLNDLLLDASKAYWDWFTAYHQMEIFEEARALAQERFEGVRQSVLFGDRPSMDTVEALIQVQNRQIALQGALLKHQNARALLEVYLWDSGRIPLEIKESTIPQMLESRTEKGEALVQIDTSLQNHPILKRQQLEISQWSVEQRLKRENLKPMLNLKYQLISEMGNTPGWNAGTFDNHMLGIDVSFPIFLRKERGELKLAKIKYQEAELKLKPQEAKLKYAFRAAMNLLETTGEQIEETQKMVVNYEMLLNGERELFQAGESSLFLVNSREQGYIGAKVKYIELVGKNQLALVQTKFARGDLFEM